MSLLVDTHVLIWWLEDNDRLPADMRQAISAGDTDVFVSAATTWEMSIKASSGRLVLPDGLADVVEAQGLSPLPVTFEDGLAAGSLPRHHEDPFDRMLIAQAIRRDLLLLSVDRQFADYPVRLLSSAEA